ncbi:WGR domain-containing protein [Paracoccus sediminis]|uniref:WGR domain-containing protein n=1 Tax=Paracoccus sediminis TaxID=1214787 RepID=A0A238WKD7_9RHOB|nr:WGR domain-containing protein [Paracoccus sediminis]TBN50550.1 WGR domain-containing protein [Paracoccus sediminis]SNR46704.1 WGR domain-containing protein, predicted DNA-binding domain in MolR [Paracoccus sediminis]
MATRPDNVLLDRIDPHRNMARFYRLDIVPDLFGGVVLVRNWGRIGRRGQERCQWFAEPADAVREQAAWIRRKTRRGYEEVDVP